MTERVGSPSKTEASKAASGLAGRRFTGAPLLSGFTNVAFNVMQSPCACVIP